MHISSSPPPSSPMSYATGATTAPTTPYAFSSRDFSTAPSSPPPVESAEVIEDDDEEENLSEEDRKKWDQLGPFLEKVTLYARILKDQMEKAKLFKPEARSSPPPSTKSGPGESTSAAKSETNSGKGKKRVHSETNPDAGGEASSKKSKITASEDAGDDTTFRQPALITGAQLKDYQLEGVAWMAGLYQNGISGILADEMGLGKTLQTIAFHAFLRERSRAPFLVVCPLSVLNNWSDEFKKFAPQIPTCMYHGTPEERAELRRTKMVFRSEQERIVYWLGDTPSVAPSRSQSSKKSAPSKRGQPSTSKSNGKSISSYFQKQGGGQPGDIDEKDLPPHMMTTFPVVITTYEMLMKDRVHLSAYRWGFIVVDEGHRLKNMDCKLMQEIKQLTADGRMVLTGTPLHNNLAELWSLLNFILPDLFTDLYTFQDWFNLPAIQASASTGRTSKVISTLHTILRPFLLRRLKVDVETNLPPKKEYVLYAPLSERQREVYDAIVQGSLRALLLREKGVKKRVIDGITIDEEVEKESGGSIKTRSKRKAKPGLKERKYDLDGDDDEYFRKLESGELEAENQKRRDRTAEELGNDWHYKAELKKVNNMKLQNTVMSLRKVCSHPFLFDWPVDPNTMLPVLNDELINASGKMLVLDRLLEELFRRNHKVLLFSQFTTMLDIIQDWAQEFKGWPIARIDGSTSMVDRRDEVAAFQNGGDSPNAPKLFLLSTRAGGLGLNLVAADTVIFYDQDWNPQMDLQAQDRAHRIGQTKPVLIFRLVSAHTIETKIMQRANEKRKLEALVIAKGKFKSITQQPTKPGKKETIAEMAAALLRLEGEKIQVVKNDVGGKGKKSVISDEDMEMLLDRRPEVFLDRGKGWTSEEQKTGVKRDRNDENTAFAVYEAPAHVGNDALAGMLGEPIDE